jgi:hypothetical protein
MRGILNQIFILIALLIIVVYWKGASTMAGTLGNGFNTILMTLQGRNPQNGNFQDYPKQN